MIYYYEVLNDRISLPIDTEVGYYHHFKKGDIIHIETNEFNGNQENLLSIIITNGINHIYNSEYFSRYLVLDWDKTTSEIILLSNKNYFFEVTDRELRNNKINEIINYEV